MPAQKIFAAAALAGALVLSSVPASAADRSAEVRYGDLDLTSQADIALLKQRVALAVKHVCGNANIRNLREVEDMKRCRNEASTRSHNDLELALENARDRKSGVEGKVVSVSGILVGGRIQKQAINNHLQRFIHI